MQVWPKPLIWLHRISGLVIGLTMSTALLLMTESLWSLLGSSVGALYYYRGTMRYRRRRNLTATPFPEPWRSILRQRVKFYACLDKAGQALFEQNVRIFLAEQRIIGVHGVLVTTEMRLLVAASAAMLSHGLRDWEWENVRDILIYPGSFDEDYQPSHAGTTLGMVHMQGPVILSSHDLKHGFRGSGDGENVAIHELAHVMDMADGYADGVPAGVDWMAEAPWIEHIAEGLKRERDPLGRHALDVYATKNEAEFFAVAVEAFFERPELLRERDSKLYDLLKQYFRVDPAALYQRRSL